MGAGQHYQYVPNPNLKWTSLPLTLTVIAPSPAVLPMHSIVWTPFSARTSSASISRSPQTSNWGQIRVEARVRITVEFKVFPNQQLGIEFRAKVRKSKGLD